MNYLSLISIFLFSSSFNQKTYISDPTNYYKVEKIDSISKYYLIYVRRSDGLFKIVSEKKEPIREGCDFLKVNNYYPLILESVFDSAAQGQILHIGGLRVENATISIEELGMVHNLYYDDRIQGLNFCK